jgi:cytochrome d ubiquinol oxidase subunit I
VDSWDVLADAAENLRPARMQMALSLGWHIVFSCFGIAFPLITVFTEWRGHRRRDPTLTALVPSQEPCSRSRWASSGRA